MFSVADFFSCEQATTLVISLKTEKGIQWSDREEIALKEVLNSDRGRKGSYLMPIIVL